MHHGTKEATPVAGSLFVVLGPLVWLGSPVGLRGLHKPTVIPSPPWGFGRAIDQ